MDKKVLPLKHSVKGKVVSVGIDVHSLSWQIAALTDGEVIMAVTISKPDYPKLKALLVRLQGNTLRVAYEAGPAGFDLYDKLTADGIECIVVPPSLIPIESGNRVKTDKRDSYKLAKLLESNMLKKVWVLTPEQRAHRQLVRTRRQITDHRSDVMRQIKSLLLFNSINIPLPACRHWGTAFTAWLRSFDYGSDHLARSFHSLLDLYQYLTQQKRTITEEVMRLAHTETYAQRVALLKSVPGIGILSAVEILVELQDVSRFQTADQLAAYAGLTPSQYSSGERIRMGHITHAGNTRLRTTLVECCWILIWKDPAMRAKYESIKKRRGAKRAIVAISRKLCACIRRMLLDNVAYRVSLPKAA
jgi:transposase